MKKLLKIFKLAGIYILIPVVALAALTVPQGGTDKTTFTTGLLKSPGGTAGFVTATDGTDYLSPTTGQLKDALTVCASGCDYTTTGTNDDVQINAALTAAGAGGYVVVKAGTYNISNTIYVLNSGTFLDILGTLQTTSNSVTALQFGDTTHNVRYTQVRINSIVGSGASGATGDGILMQNASFNHIFWGLINKFNYGIYFNASGTTSSPAAFENRLYGGEVVNNNVGIDFSTTRTIMQGNYITASVFTNSIGLQWETGGNSNYTEFHGVSDNALDFAGNPGVDIEDNVGKQFLFFYYVRDDVASGSYWHDDTILENAKTSTIYAGFNVQANTDIFAGAHLGVGISNISQISSGSTLDVHRDSGVDFAAISNTGTTTADRSFLRFLRGTDDWNLGINTSGNTTDNKLQLKYDTNASALELATTGEIGIGASPASGIKLLLNDSNRVIQRIIGTNATDTIFSLQNTATNGQEWQLRSNATSGEGNGGFSIYDPVVSTTRLSIAPTTGNVGIGTVSQAAKLEVSDTNSGALNDALILRNNTLATGTETGLFFAPTTATGTTRGARISAINEDGANAIGLKFYTGTTGSITEKMRITHDGKIGIGTGATVSALLHVIGTTEQQRLGYDASNYMSSVVDSSGNAGLTLTGTSPVFTFNNQSNFINTSAGAVADQLIVRNNSLSTGTESGIFFAPTTAAGITRGARITGINEDGANAIGLKFYTGTTAAITSKMTINHSGEVGIGVASPTAYLELPAGTSTPAVAPLKIDSGTLVPTTQAGAIENDGTHLYYTAANAGTRYQLDQQGGAVSSVSNSDSTLTISPTTGAVMASLNLGHANTWTGAQTISTAPFTISGNQSTSAWTTNGTQLSVAAATLTDSTSSGTVTTMGVSAFGVPTLVASSATTYTNSATLYIAAAPTSSTNVTQTNPMSLYIAAGRAVFNGGFSSSTTNTSSNFNVGGGGNIGSSTNVASLLFGGASNVQLRSLFNGATSTTLATGTSYANVLVGSSPVTQFGSGTHAWMANFVVNPIGTVGGSGSTITNTATSYIGSASTAGTNNYSLYVNGPVASAAAQTVVNCSTSGTVTFSEPFDGPSYKQVVAYESACLGTASYTFPRAFTNTPDAIGVAGVKHTAISTTATTVTGTTTTGFSQLYGY